MIYLKAYFKCFALLVSTLGGAIFLTRAAMFNTLEIGAFWLIVLSSLGGPIGLLINRKEACLKKYS